MGLELPPLGYPADALEPHIDAMTMNIHHGKHHAAYVTNLQKAVEAEGLAGKEVLSLIRDLEAIPESVRMAVRNNGGGHVNHTLFWRWMAPGSTSPAPAGKLADGLRDAFSNLEGFKTAFGDAAAKRFGSGWAWLVVKPGGKLAVVSTPNQDNPWMKGVVPDADVGIPILGIDVWEHAYYLHYQNRRADYVAAWWNVVNWDEVTKSYTAATA
ncbi:MAG TPA: superoxide dismutase [Verrucomicrobiales bacterium]|nr:superoxide dismutase [Verrucomicrobiales bacterium]